MLATYNNKNTNKTVILVDLENVQQIDRKKLYTYSYIFVFANSKQLKHVNNFINDNLQYVHNISIIKTEQSGKNSADFFLVHYLSQLSINKKYKNSNFYVYSNDKGYDGVIAYINNTNCNNCFVERISYKLASSAKTANNNNSENTTQPSIIEKIKTVFSKNKNDTNKSLNTSVVLDTHTINQLTIQEYTEEFIKWINTRKKGNLPTAHDKLINSLMHQLKIDKAQASLVLNNLSNRNILKVNTNKTIDYLLTGNGGVINNNIPDSVTLYDRSVKALSSREIKHRPASLKSLHNFLTNAIPGENIDIDSARLIVELMQKEGFISLQKNKIIYKQ